MADTSLQMFYMSDVSMVPSKCIYPVRYTVRNEVATTFLERKEIHCFEMFDFIII